MIALPGWVRHGTMPAMVAPYVFLDLHTNARHFVRERLGCGCPDELLDHIEIETRTEPEALTQLKVGGRLLVHVRPCPPRGELARALARWVADGVTQRDALAFNRFRLVLVLDDPDAMRARAESRFATLGVDEKTHLHLVSPADAGPLLPARN